MRNRLVFFSTNPIVRGYHNDIIIDFQRDRILKLPKSFAPIVKKLENGTLNHYEYTTIDRKKITEYIRFIEENELGFFCNSKEKINFPKLKNSIEFPSIINVLDISIRNVTFNKLIKINNIITLGKTFHAFFIFEQKSISNFNLFIDFIGRSRLNSLEIAFKFPPSKKILHQIFQKCPKAVKVFVYNSDSNLLFQESNKLVFRINQSMENMILPNTNKHIPYLNNNIVSYTVSFQKNSYFNKRLYIDNKMNVYSSLTKEHFLGISQEIFKNIGSLSKILQSRKLEFWGIPKSKIDICKSCEFNRICIDNRIPKQRSNGSWYYISECSYNPFIGKWDGEQENQAVMKESLADQA